MSIFGIDVLSNLDKCDHFGRTLLIYAVLGEQPECVSFLLKCGANINAVDKSGRSALLWAAYKVMLLIAMIFISNFVIHSSKLLMFYLL